MIATDKIASFTDFAFCFLTRDLILSLVISDGPKSSNSLTTVETFLEPVFLPFCRLES